MRTRHARTLALTVLLSTVLTACAATAHEPPVDGTRASGVGWSASFPGEVVQEELPFPVDGLDEPLTGEVTYWESDSEAVMIQVVTIPPNDGDAAENLLRTAASLGEVQAESPLLDGPATFRGLPAAVTKAERDEGTLLLLAFMNGDTLYQLMHITATPNAPDRLADLASSLVLE